MYKIFYDERLYKKLAGMRFFNLMRGNAHVKHSNPNIDSGKERSASTIAPR